jgi:hypothetical protein
LGSTRFFKIKWEISKSSIGLGVDGITSLSAYYDNQITLQNKTLRTIPPPPPGEGVLADVI